MGEVSADHVLWPADARVPPDEVTVGDLLRRVAGQVPDRIALVDGQAAAADRSRWRCGPRPRGGCSMADYRRRRRTPARREETG
ncbi:MAG: hypothetical protein ACRDND_13610 [Streptosporangiaceae bacterium]